MAGRRSLLAVLVSLVGMAVVAVGVVLSRGDRPAASFAPDSPESALQAYLAAWDAGDDSAAWGEFSARARAASAEADWRTAADQQRARSDSAHRLLVEGITTNGSVATLRVTIETTTVGGMSVGRTESAEAVPLVREGGAWRIDELLLGPSPWRGPGA